MTYGMTRWTMVLALSLGTLALATDKKPDAAAAPKAETSATEKPVKLLWVRSKYNGSIKDRLVESEKLTVAEYKKRGIDVVELQSDDLDKWRDGEGKDYARANKYMQYLAYGKQLGVDAIGGLAVFEVTPELEEAFEGKKAGDYVHGWGISLRSCDSNFQFNLEGGDTARAIPMSLVEDDEWAIPRKINARSCESSGLEPDAMDMMNKGRPFLGVQLDTNKVISVVPNSPAELAGVVVGDTLISVGGTEINSLIDLSGYMQEKKPGDDVEIAYEHEGNKAAKTVKLADRAEVQAKNSPDGKPLPALTGKDINGKDVKLADLKGKVILLDFWATWCGPCIEEMPLIQLTWENLKDKGLVWVGVSGDEDDDAWREFVKNNNLGGTQLRDEKWLSAMGIGGFPTIFLVDKGGLVGCRVRGGSIAQAAAAMVQN